MLNGQENVYSAITSSQGVKEAVREALRRWYAFIGVAEGLLPLLNDISIMVEESSTQVQVVVDLFRLNKNQMAGPFIGPGGAHIRALQGTFSFPIKTQTGSVDITKSVFAHALYSVFGKKEVVIRFDFN